MGFQNVFKRYELKYLLTKEQKQVILDALQPYMEQDAFGRSTIRNIYYDTPNKQLIRTSLEKPVYKEKLRVRSYKTATPDSTVFIELKKKYKSVVYKRRVSVAEQDAMQYLNEGKKLPIQNQITKEMDYFCKFYGNLEPAMFLTYDREAFYGKEDKDLRITFDENILWRTEDVSLCSEVYGAQIIDEGYALMEVKIAGAMPLWLAQTLSENQIFKTSFSKYGNAYLQQQKRIEKQKLYEFKQEDEACGKAACGSQYLQGITINEEVV